MVNITSIKVASVLERMRDVWRAVSGMHEGPGKEINIVIEDEADGRVYVFSLREIEDVKTVKEEMAKKNTWTVDAILKQRGFYG